MLTPMRNQLSLFWNKQPKSQRVVIIALGLALLILVPVLIIWSNTPSYVVAYSGLSETDAAQIVQKLDESGIPYQLKNSTTILVEANQVYKTRLLMAREGLPQSSTVGYELFSGNTLGMTEFTQKVNYQRALEGELERTIGSLAAVKAVRVHVVTPEKSLLSNNQQPATASVTVTLNPGQSIDKAQVQAITHLVASSVEGLKPENIAVIDSEGNMLASGTGDQMDATSSESDSRRQAENAAADEIRTRVQGMLDKTLGPNKAIVQASVAMDWKQREVTSNTYDPTPSAIRSSQKVNETYDGAGAASMGGVPGAATNLPTAVPTGTVVSTGNGAYSHTEETINYEVSQVQSKEVTTPGQIDRVTVSVMVDNITDAQQLDSIKAAVAAAAGVNETRGDQVVVSSMAFDRSYYNQQDAAAASQEQTDTYIRYGSIGAGILGLIILIAFFLRSIRNVRQASTAEWRPIMQPVSQMALEASNSTGLPMQIPALPENQETNAIPAEVAQPTPVPAPVKIEAPKDISARQRLEEDDQRASIITKLAEESPATVAEIIQIWLSSEDKRNG